MSSTAFPSTGGPPPLIAGPLPPVPSKATGQDWSMRQPITILLSLCFGLFLADAMVSLLDDSLILLFDIRVLEGLRGIVFVFTVLVGLLTYGLMGFAP